MVRIKFNGHWEGTGVVDRGLSVLFCKCGFLKSNCKCKGSEGMDMKQFSVENKKRCESPLGFGHDINSWGASDWFTATIGEFGEAANVAKKLNRIRNGLKGNAKGETEESLKAKLRKELADAFIYLDLLATSEGIDLASAVVDTFNEKSAEIGYPVILT